MKRLTDKDAEIEVLQKTIESALGEMEKLIDSKTAMENQYKVRSSLHSSQKPRLSPNYYQALSDLLEFAPPR